MIEEDRRRGSWELVESSYPDRSSGVALFRTPISFQNSSPLSTCIIHLPGFTIFLKSPETKTIYKQNTVKMVKAGKIPCSIFVTGPGVDGSPL